MPTQLRNESAPRPPTATSDFPPEPPPADDLPLYGVGWQAAVKRLQKACWQCSEDHGWHEDVDDPRIFVEKLALIHSEASEALEEYRDGRAFTLTYYREQDGKPEGIPSELADIIIRVCDLAEIFHIDLASAVLEKHEFNLTRPYRHGGKQA